MVAAGHYDWKNPDINDVNFKVTGAGVIVVTLELVSFDRQADSNFALDYCAKHNLRPALIEDLLAFGETYPAVQRHTPIMCPGTAWTNPESEEKEMPCLVEDCSERLLSLYMYACKWQQHWCMLARRS